MLTRLNKFLSLFFLLFLLLSFTTEADFTTPPSEKEVFELREVENIPYYDDDDPSNSEFTQLNLIIPEGLDNPPVFIWVGGGAWAYVNRHKEMNLCRQMAKQGILMISVGHSLSPALLSKPQRTAGIQHPEHVKDIAQAFSWVYKHAEEYGYSTENIFVGGFSSGAHLAALLAADSRYLESKELSPKNIRAIIPVGGAYDIPHYKASLFKEDPSMIERHIHAVFGTTDAAYVDASPITYLDDFDTPMLLISERETYEYSIVFEQALNKKGVKNYQALNCHSETHSSLWKKLSSEKDNIQRDFIVAYIQSMQGE